MKQLFLHQNHAEEPWSIGGAAYLDDYPAVSLVGVRCRFGGAAEEQIALLDTAATWPICRKEVADSLGISEEAHAIGREKLSTRLGPINGYLARCEITLFSEFGEQLNTDGTCFISEEWTGPNVIGWKGCLERIRFAIDPRINIIFYGQF